MIEFLRTLLAAIVEMFKNNGAKPAPTPTKDFDVDLIREWEGLRLSAYQDTGGVWTIGYGHTKTARPEMVITKEQAIDLLYRDVAWAEKAVNKWVSVPLNYNQKSALVSFVFNIGETQFRNSTLLRVLNEGRYDEVGEQLMRWVYDEGVRIPGLVNRRKAERRRFEDD